MNEQAAQGRVIWITGLSGAGKTTLANATAELIREQGIQPILLDGDEIRDAIRDPHTGHDHKSRLANAWRICRLARMLSNQGHTLLVATMSLFREVHEWNRMHLPRYREIYIKSDVKLLCQRDSKGLYARATRGELKGLPGLDMDYDEPISPDLILDNKEPFMNPSALALGILNLTIDKKDKYLAV